MNPMAMMGAQVDPLQAFAALASGQQQPQAEVESPLARALAYAQQQQAQLGPAPQMDPTTGSDMMQGERQRELANALMSSGYVENSGALGSLAQIFSAYKGGKLDTKAGETMADALRRETEQQQAAAQYAGQREAFDKGPGKILEMAERAKATGYEPTAAELASGEYAKQSTPKGFQASGGFLVNKDTGESRPIDGYMEARERIAAAGRSPSGGGGGGYDVLSADEAAELGLPTGTVAQRDPKGKVSIVSKPTAGTAGAAPKPLPAEARMKLGMLKSARQALENYQGEVLPEGGGFNESRLFIGPGGGYLDEAINNVLRVESGAAVPEEETKRGVARYGAGIFNQESTARANAQQLRDKIDILERELTGGVSGGQSAPPPAAAPITAGQDLGNGIKVRSVRPAGQ